MANDSLWKNLGQVNKQPGQQAVGSASTSPGANGAVDAGAGSNIMASPTTAQSNTGSPDAAGSGFVNLSHMLALNGASGQQTARNDANSITSQGKTAQDNLQSAEDKYNQDVEKGTTRSNTYEAQASALGAPGIGEDQGGGRLSAPVGFYQAGANKAAQGYSGPNSLADTSGYGRVSKEVGTISNKAQNATTGAGMAANVQQATGLSARQAAASAFYEGVTNPYQQHAGNNYKGLGKMLNDANARSSATSDLARRVTNDSVQRLSQDEADQDAYYNQVAAASQDPANSISRINPETGTPFNQDLSPDEVAARQAENDRQTQASHDAKIGDDNSAKGRSGNTNGLADADNINFAIGQGEDPQLAQGVDYDTWVSEGRPTYEEWKAKYGPK